MAKSLSAKEGQMLQDTLDLLRKEKELLKAQLADREAQLEYFRKTYKEEEENRVIRQAVEKEEVTDALHRMAQRDYQAPDLELKGLTADGDDLHLRINPLIQDMEDEDDG